MAFLVKTSTLCASFGFAVEDCHLDLTLCSVRIRLWTLLRNDLSITKALSIFAFDVLISTCEAKNRQKSIGDLTCDNGRWPVGKNNFRSMKPPGLLNTISL